MNRDIEMGENCTARIARRLQFSPSGEDDLHESEDHGVRSVADLNISMGSAHLSPDQLNSFRVRSRRLFESPATPKLLVNGRDANRTPATAIMATPAPTRTRARALFTAGSAAKSSVEEGRERQPAANVNPFTPSGRLLTGKRTRSQRNSNGSSLNSLDQGDASDDSDEEVPLARMALHQTDVARFHKEFQQVSLLGQGEFGSVHKCIHRLDGCVYAVKKSRTPVAGSANELSAMNEVWAHAVLGQHPHVVRYHSAWAENGHVIIQNEFCNAGTLQQLIARNKQNDVTVTEHQLKTTLLQLAQGLGYMHSKQLAHMDMKPANIFMCRQSAGGLSIHRDGHDGFDQLERDDGHDSSPVTYKIGDLGHVTSTVGPVRVEEGDCRYLPVEILREDYSHLAKADVFALGLTIYQMAGGGPLAQNGQEWHAIRRGRLPHLAGRCSLQLHALLEQMIHPDPIQRPSAYALTQHPALVTNAAKTKDQLSRQLNAERLKNRQLTDKLEEAARQLEHLLPLTSMFGSGFAQQLNSSSTAAAQLDLLIESFRPQVPAQQ